MPRQEERIEERREVQMQGSDAQQFQKSQQFQQGQQQVRQEEQNTSYTHTEVRAPVVNAPPPIIATGAGTSQISNRLKMS